MRSRDKIISNEEVQHIASLCRLGLSGQEIKLATKHLADILGHFVTIQKIDTKKTATSEDITGLNNITRSDQPDSDQVCSRDTLLEYAPEVSRDHIKVKAVF